MHSLHVKNVYPLPFYESDSLARALNKFNFPLHLKKRNFVLPYSVLWEAVLYGLR